MKVESREEIKTPLGSFHTVRVQPTAAAGVVTRSVFEELGKRSPATGLTEIESWASKLGADRVFRPRQADTKYAGVTSIQRNRPFRLSPTLKELKAA